MKKESMFNWILGLLMAAVAVFAAQISGFEVGAWHVIVICLLSMPYSYKGDLYSLWGGWAPGGSAYSLFGVVQVAGMDAISALGVSFYQNAFRYCAQWIGVSFYQNAAKDCIQVCGISVYQKGNFVAQIVGLSVYQKGAEGYVAAGIAIVQKTYDKAILFIGLSVCQLSEQCGNIVGMVFFQKGVDSFQILGLLGYQELKIRAMQVVGLTCYRYCPDVETLRPTFDFVLFRKQPMT